MKTWLSAFTSRARVVSVLLSLVTALATMSAPSASAATDSPQRAQLRDSATSSDLGVQAVYRGSYWYYVDCDLAGFIGVYYGLWRSYSCEFNTRARLWDLYA